MRDPQRRDFLSSRVQYLPAEQIRPNPRQPRREFDQAGLRELADSIRAFGILQPLTVRRTGREYELVAGERRLRAARLAGLRQVPCLIAQVGEEDSALLALIENLQRRDLDCWEEAEAIARLIRQYGLSQEAAAEKLGKSQSGIANKLRLLRLPEGVRQLIRQNGLTERHARALLRLPDQEAQRRAVAAIVRGGWNVVQTEAYVERQLREIRTTPPGRRTTYIIKDVRLFLNSVDRGVQMMRQAGVDARWERQDGEEGMTLIIRIPAPGRKKGQSVVTEM